MLYGRGQRDSGAGGTGSPPVQVQDAGRSRRPPGPLRAHEIMNVRDFLLSKILKRLDVGR